MLARALQVVLAGSLAACSGEGAAPECRANLAQPITGGRERLEGGASSELVQSLARITFGNDERGGLCSGLALSDSSVLTAAHCVHGAQGSELLVELPSAAGELQGVVARGWREHDWLDAAVIDVPLPTASVPRSWRLATREDSIAVGSRLTLAGFGVREDGELGELRFVEEEVVGVDAESFFVDGHGVTGACRGDSGGPAVSLDGDQAIVFGTLSAGSASCSGVDHYVRADALADLLTTPARAAGCEPG